MSDWRERLVPEALRLRLKELVRDDAETRLLHQLLGEPKIYEWLHGVAVLKDPVLRGLVPAIPPRSLREITAHAEPEWFLWTGLADVEAMMSLLDEFGAFRASPRPRLLDFGAGAGRLLRFLYRQDDRFELHGADVNPDHVAWCAEHLRPVRFVANGARPPLPYPDAHFDGLWTLSVFTHLDEAASDAWRAELARVLKPGGVLIATTHGETALAKFAAEPALQERFRIAGSDAAALAAGFAARPFAFVPYDADVLAKARAGDVYGTTFVHPSYVARRWNDAGLEVLAHRPAALRGWQDVVVLRRRT